MKVSTCSYRPILAPCGLKNLDYQVDSYVGCEHYCYYCYALNQVETDWTKEVLIHKDITGQLRGELEKISPDICAQSISSKPRTRKNAFAGSRSLTTTLI